MLDRALDGKYRLLRLLGQGGMGSVYEAEEIATERRVAIKVIRDLARIASPEALLARFQREAKAAMAIDSPHVARVLATGIEAETLAPFMVMEYLHGEDLEQVLAHVDPLPPALALRIAGQACSGLQKAHEAGVIHRDIKPANIFLARDADGGIEVKILDFGIARIEVERQDGAESTRLTHTGGVLGSPIFMSPEQALGSKLIDPRTDVWSLGVVLHRALTGHLHHEGLDTVGQIILAICSRPVRPIQELAPWLSAEVAALVHRALQIDPALRFPSAAAMLAAIEAALPGGLEAREEMFVPLSARERAGPAPIVIVPAGSAGAAVEELSATALGATSLPDALDTGATQEDPWDRPQPGRPTAIDPEETVDVGARTSPERPALPASPPEATTGRELAGVTPVAPGRLRSPWPPRIGAALAVMGAVGLAASAFTGALPLRAPRAVAPVPLASAPPSTRDLPRVCLELDGGPSVCSETSDAIGWCDGAGRRIACCGHGLVPLGADGRCACSPGGTRVSNALSHGCPPPPPGAAEESAQRRRGMVERVIACFDPARRAGNVDGGEFSGEYVLGPEGEVLSAGVKISSVPDTAAQTCALGVVGATRFSPPPGEDVGRPLDFGFQFLTRGERERGAAPDPPASSAPTPSSEPPLRHPCANPRADATCQAPWLAWCDSVEKPIACCAKGLAAVGQDGLCACPPGGSTEVPGAPPTCPKAKAGPGREQIQAIVRAAFGTLRPCYEGALAKAANVEGRVSVTFELTPEGRVFSARVAQASLPDAEAQACLLRAFRRLVFDAPPDGHRQVTYPLIFTLGPD